jgi:hypothetical protein
MDKAVYETKAGDQNRADHFFSMPGARADRWRALHSAAQSWAKGKGSQIAARAAFDELGAYEDYFAYPGRSLIAASATASAPANPKAPRRLHGVSPKRSWCGPTSTTPGPGKPPKGWPMHRPN